MRILLTTDTIGGVWTFTRELTTDLLRRGHSVALVSFGRQPSYEQQSWCAAQTSTFRSAFQYTASNAPLEWMQNNEFVFRHGAGVLTQVASHFRPDILHSNQFCFGALALGIPSLVTAHSDVLSWAQICRPQGLERSRWLTQYRQLVTDGLAGCDLVTAPTRWMATELARHYSTAPVRVVLNGRTVSPPASSPRCVQAVTVGRLWDEAKNIAMLRDVHAPVPIYVAGERQHGDSTAPRQLGRSILLGPLPESSLLALFAKSSAYLATSIYEPFGLAPLEAALCGCAVLANDIPSFREVWGDAALYFTSARSLSILLHQLQRNRGELALARERAHTRARQLAAQRMTDAYEALYSDLVAARPALGTHPGIAAGLAAHAA
jgi:glycosyltransferase involved in cell wall biosynthesis